MASMDWRLLVMTNYERIKMATKEEVLMLLFAAVLPLLDDYSNSEKYEIKKQYEKFLDEEFSK